MSVSLPRQLGIDDSVPLLTFDAPAHFYEGAEIFIVDDMPEIQQVHNRIILKLLQMRSFRR